MPLPEIASCFRVAFNWFNSTSGGNAENVMHFTCEAGEASDVGDAINATMTDDQLNFSSSLTVLQSLSITPLDGTTATLVYPISTIDGATPSSEGIPNSCAIVTAYTARRGRSYRGRVYLPYLSELASEVGHLKTAYRDSLQTGWAGWQARLEAQSPAVTWVVASYKHATAEAITSVHVQEIVGTQRRRQSQLR